MTGRYSRKLSASDGAQHWPSDLWIDGNTDDGLQRTQTLQSKHTCRMTRAVLQTILHGKVQTLRLTWPVHPVGVCHRWGVVLEENLTATCLSSPVMLQLLWKEMTAYQSCNWNIHISLLYSKMQRRHSRKHHSVMLNSCEHLLELILCHFNDRQTKFAVHSEIALHII